MSPCLLLNFLPSGPNNKGRWQKSGIVAGDIVKFRYGPNKITATSSVKPIDILFKEGKFNIDDYIERGNISIIW